MPVRQWRAYALPARRVPVTVSEERVTTDRAARMARFAAGACSVIARALTVGGLLAAGWLLATLFGLLTATPAAAETTPAAADVTSAAQTTPAVADVTSAAAGTTPAAADVTSAAQTTPAAAETTAATGADIPQAVAGFPTAGGTALVMDTAEAMAGAEVDGLTSQSKPGFPAPSTAGKSMGAKGLAPNSGGNGPFGPGMGDLARSCVDPRETAQRAPLACVLPPVFRTAADDPSFSPD
ncbi:hypothetical protein ACWENQ_08835 [Nonomuraea sp. NPDC004354]